MKISDSVSKAIPGIKRNNRACTMPLIPLLAAIFTIAIAAPTLAQSSIPREETWVTNGTVSAIATTPTTTYIGGEFTYVGPYTGSGVPIDATTRCH